MRNRAFAALAVLALVGGCLGPWKDTPVDEMANWTRAEHTFTLAVEAVTLAGKAGQIDKSFARSVEPLIDEGYGLLKDVRMQIAITPVDQDPVIEVDAVARLLRIGVKISAVLAIEKQKKETQ